MSPGAEPKRVLARLPNWIGDAVMAAPAISLLVEKSGAEMVGVYGPPKAAALFEAFPGISRIFALDEKKEPDRLEEIRNQAFTHVYLFTNSYSSARIAHELGIPNRTGYRRDWRGHHLTRRIWCGPRTRALRMAEYYLNLLPVDWRCEPCEIQPKLYLTDEERAAPQQALTEAGAKGLKGLVGLAPGAAFGTAKQWEIDGFMAVAKTLASEGWLTAAFGAEGDRAVAEEILRGLPEDQCLNLAGKTGLRELMAWIEAASCLVTNDSGPMHLADALSTPTVAIFGSTDSAWTGPRHAHHQVIQSDLACSPCFLRECPIGKTCMKSISAELVLEKARLALEANFRSKNP